MISINPSDFQKYITLQMTKTSSESKSLKDINKKINYEMPLTEKTVGEVCFKYTLKVVSAAFLLVCFLSLN